MSMTTAAVEAPSRARPGAQRELSARAQSFDFPPDTPRHWLGADPYMSNLMNALSLTFPEGERFFIAAVRHYREQVTDPSLQRQVRGFLAQESLHRREHDGFNDWLRGLGFSVDRYYEEIVAMLAPDGLRSSPKVRLAITCALEHFTAIMANGWLTRDELREQADPRVRALWTWHALEELDHKAVAFDVYQTVNGSYTLRCTVMLLTTLHFISTVSRLHYRMMKEDGQHKSARLWLSGLWKCWGPNGYFSTLIPDYLAYFRPGFHPWDRDDSALVTRFERELAGAPEAAPAS